MVKAGSAHDVGPGVHANIYPKWTILTHRIEVNPGDEGVALLPGTGREAGVVDGDGFSGDAILKVVELVVIAGDGRIDNLPHGEDAPDAAGLPRVPSFELRPIFQPDAAAQIGPPQY